MIDVVLVIGPESLGRPIAGYEIGQSGQMPASTWNVAVSLS